MTTPTPSPATAAERIQDKLIRFADAFGEDTVGDLIIPISDLRTVLAERKELAEALQACAAYIPGSEVRSWPPGHELKKRAMSLTLAALAKLPTSPTEK